MGTGGNHSAPRLDKRGEADTIVAVSSPPGRSLRGLIRMSGPRAIDITAAITTCGLADSPRKAAAVRLHDPPIPALAVVFHGPHSFTGEDSAELQVPGHPALLDRLLHQAIAAGARLAEPGEFTFRAFTAGKIDLTQAEGIAATITAVSDGQLRAASMLREGELGRIASRFVDELGTHLALVEAGIDFVDQEDVVPIPPTVLDDHLADLVNRLDTLLSRSRSWGAIEALPRIVLVGPPSAGKSTLFNALLGRQRAVISPMPGTTRDLLAEPLELTTPAGQRIEVMLVDIAGLDPQAALLDREAQAVARRAIERADLILRLHEAGTSEAGTTDAPSPPDLFAMPDAAAPQLHIRTKVDLVPRSAEGHNQRSASGALRVSAVTGQGMEQLRQALVEHLGGRGVSATSQMLALQPRHEAGLHSALEHLRTARALLTPHRDAPAIVSVELVADSLRAALDDLAALGGQLTPDDVIGRVFATFCVGK